MTVATTETNQQFVGDGVVTQFSVTYKVLDESHIKVYIDSVLQVSGYTVTLNPDQDNTPGADIDFAVAPVVDATVNILRVVPLNQLVDYQPFDAFPAETHEGALDKLTMLVQQLQDELNRVGVPPPGIPDGDTLIDGSLVVTEDASAGNPPTQAAHLTRKDYVNAQDQALQDQITAGLSEYSGALNAASTNIFDFSKTGAQRIVVSWKAFSSDENSNPYRIRLRAGGSTISTGYISNAIRLRDTGSALNEESVESTTEFPVVSTTIGDDLTGELVLQHVGDNVWTANGIFMRVDQPTTQVYVSGYIELASEITGITSNTSGTTSGEWRVRVDYE